MDVICEYCNKKFQKVPSKIRKHNFCSNECKYKFNDKRKMLICDVCGKEFKESSTHRNRNNKNHFCSSECYHKFLENNGTRKGQKISEETRIKMSKAARGEKNHFFGKHLTEEHKKKISEGCKGHRGAWTGKRQPIDLIKKRTKKLIGKICSEDTKKKISESNTGKQRTDECREQNSKRMLELYKNGEFNPIKKSKNGFFESLKNKCKLHYRSSYELYAYEILEKDNNVEAYKTENIGIPYLYEGIKHHYIPDIYAVYKNGIHKIIEIKASWALNEKKNIAKFKAAKEYCKTKSLLFEIWTEKELKICNKKT